MCSNSRRRTGRYVQGTAWELPHLTTEGHPDMHTMSPSAQTHFARYTLHQDLERQYLQKACAGLGIVTSEGLVNSDMHIICPVSTICTDRLPKVHLMQKDLERQYLQIMYLLAAHNLGLLAVLQLTGAGVQLLCELLACLAGLPKCLFRCIPGRLQMGTAQCQSWHNCLVRLLVHKKAAQPQM